MSGSAKNRFAGICAPNRHNKSMVPKELHTLFWDVSLGDFDPSAYPDYTIFRVLECGDLDAVKWLRALFSEDQIRRVLLAEQRLSPSPRLFGASLITFLRIRLPRFATNTLAVKDA